jgi:large subunit ribosomal protein L29
VTRVRELRDLDDEELIVRLESSKEELFNLRFQLATGQLDNPMRIKDVRHDVARILTILRERDLDRELEEAEAAAAAIVTEGSVADEAGEDAGAEASASEPAPARRGLLRKKEER